MFLKFKFSFTLLLVIINSFVHFISNTNNTSQQPRSRFICWSCSNKKLFNVEFMKLRLFLRSLIARISANIFLAVSSHCPAVNVIAIFRQIVSILSEINLICLFSNATETTWYDFQVLKIRRARYVEENLKIVWDVVEEKVDCWLY